ncbi:MAG: methyltransferase [Alphaproteobacteria bacterium]
MPATDSAATSPATTDDRLLGGRVSLRQPRRGYRAAIDPVLLAAAVDARRGATLLDAGLGTGAAALCLLARRPDLRVIGIEADPAACALAEDNARANGVADRLQVRCAELDAATRAMAAAGEAVAGVLTNPPYLPAGWADPPAVAGRRAAHVEGLDLAAWTAACARTLRRRGALTLIHRADRLDDAVAALAGAGFGEIAVLPLWPKPGADAGRVILRARHGIRAGARLLSGLVLHRPDGTYTDEAQAILRDAAAIVWKGSTSPAEAPS